MKILLLILLITGCEGKNSVGLDIKTPSKACVDGYIYFYSYGSQYGGSYMSPKFGKDGKLISCSMDKAEQELYIKKKISEEILDLLEIHGELYGVEIREKMDRKIPIPTLYLYLASLKEEGKIKHRKSDKIYSERGGLPRIYFSII